MDQINHDLKKYEQNGIFVCFILKIILYKVNESI